MKAAQNSSVREMSGEGSSMRNPGRGSQGRQVSLAPRNGYLPAEAIGLYQRMGFQPRGQFGPYAAMPARNIETSLFFEKKLP
jgi:hypothetical protein